MMSERMSAMLCPVPSAWPQAQHGDVHDDRSTMLQPAEIMPCIQLLYAKTQDDKATPSIRLDAVPTALLIGTPPSNLQQVVLLPLSDGLVLTSFAPLLVALLSPLLLREVPSR